MKAKPIYTVWFFTKSGNIGAQPVKALNKKEALIKFNKRFPKTKIMDINKSDKSSHIIEPI